MTQDTTWGRVAEDGTVYVRTPDGGERPVGSWQAGPAEQGLAHFALRYDDLVAEVALLERRLATDMATPASVLSSAHRLRLSLDTVAAVGDLGALATRLEALEGRATRRRELHDEKRAVERAEALAARTALADEAERLAGSNDWKGAGERLRTIGDELRALPAADKVSDAAVADRVKAAREEFTRRRSEHFAELDAARVEAGARKERLIAEAEGLSASTDWAPTARRFKELMGDWKAAGRAPREAEDGLWARFRAAQDQFFAARNAELEEREGEENAALAAKRALLAEAEALDVEADPGAAARALREIGERWEAAGRVPRGDLEGLERRYADVETAVRDAAERKWEEAGESPFLVKLRERVAEIEDKLAKARAAGRPTEELEQALATQRSWLEQGPG